MRRSLARVAVLGMLAASLSVVSGLVSPAVAGGASGTIALVSPAKPVLLGSAITLKGRFKHGGHRAFVIQRRAYFGAPWTAVPSAQGRTNGRGVYRTTFTPKHTFQYRAVLRATATKPLRYSKTLTVRLTAKWAEVSAGADHTCGIRPNGTLWCWGDNGYGDVGNDNAPYSASVPTRVKDGYETQSWSQVSAGYGYSCGVRSDHTLWCWGSNGYSELGLGDTTERHVPVRVGTASDWARVYASDLHTCAIKTTGALYCWGDNNWGELGLGVTGGTKKTPRLVDDSAVNTGASQAWLTVAPGTQHTCGIRDDNTLWCWGWNTDGVMGVDPATTGSSDVPVQVPGSWTAVSSANYFADDTYHGGGHTCGIESDGTLWCWGDDSVGQLGDLTPSTGGTTIPQQVGTNNDWTSIGAGGAFTCGTELGAALHCWGYNYWGQLGDGQFQTDSADPATSVVEGYAGQVWSRGLSVGGDHVCGIGDAKILRCWGWNGVLQLGTGTYPSHDTPTVTDAG